MAPLVKEASTTMPEQSSSKHKHHHRSIEDLIQDERWDRVEKRLARDPEEIKRKHRENIDGHNSQAYPLHYLCKKKEAPIPLVQAFVNLQKEAVSTPDSILKELPIHIACQHDAPVAFLEILVKAYPEGLLKADKDGNLPIHYACSLESPDAAHYLMDACPESVARKNKKNQTPLHLACSRYDVSLPLINDLIESHEDACKARDWQGRLPIHSACMWKANVDVIQVLLKRYPHAVLEKDEHNMTPYAICRKLVHSDTHDATVKLLRCYHKKQVSFLGKAQDVVQYKAENLSDALHIHHHKSWSHADAM